MALRAIVRELLADNPETAKRLIGTYSEEAAPKPRFDRSLGLPPDYLQMIPGLAYERIRELAQESLDSRWRGKPETFS
jgi:hypothetical protein